jgi:PTS system N-acetylglucosamine-specific IIC component
MTAVASDGLPPAARTSNPVLAVLQRIGRSLMLPIAVLPAAALLLRFGQPDVLGPGTDGLHLASRSGMAWLTPVAGVLAAAGDAIFTSLPILFAIGVAVGFAKKSDGSTALAAAVGYLVFHFVSMYLFFNVEWIDDSVKSKVTHQVVGADGKVAPALNMAARNPTFVLGGILVGIVAALLYQRYYRVKLPPYLAFFGGRRFVPIVTAGASVLLGVFMALIWGPIGAGIEDFGNWVVEQGAFGAGIFGTVNRALLPFGLHHIVNSIAWFTVGTYTNAAGVVSQGDIPRFFAGDPKAGTFMTGFFPIMMFGLPAAGIAMWQEARADRRKAIGGIMLAGAFTSFLTGVTEPLEFAFLFVAPVLFAVHAVLTGISLALMEAFGAKDGFGFSAGAIDFVINYGKATKPLLVILIGLVYAAVYYTLFRFAIRKWNIMTPGREPDEPGVIDITDSTPATREPVTPETTKPTVTT